MVVRVLECHFCLFGDGGCKIKGRVHMDRWIVRGERFVCLLNVRCGRGLR